MSNVLSPSQQLWVEVTIAQSNLTLAMKAESDALDLRIACAQVATTLKTREAIDDYKTSLTILEEARQARKDAESEYNAADGRFRRFYR